MKRSHHITGEITDLNTIQYKGFKIFKTFRQRAKSTYYWIAGHPTGYHKFRTLDNAKKLLTK